MVPQNGTNCGGDMKMTKLWELLCGELNLLAPHVTHFIELPYINHIMIKYFRARQELENTIEQPSLCSTGGF